MGRGTILRRDWGVIGAAWGWFGRFIMFVHVVLFWLKPGTADSVRDAMMKD
jgi:hypothetical protein